MNLSSTSITKTPTSSLHKNTLWMLNWKINFRNVNMLRLPFRLMGTRMGCLRFHIKLFFLPLLVNPTQVIPKAIDLWESIISKTCQNSCKEFLKQITSKYTINVDTLYAKG